MFVILSNHTKKLSLKLLTTCTVRKSAMSDLAAEKKKFVTMPLEEKRDFYKAKKYVELKDVPNWNQYFKSKQTVLEEKFKQSDLTKDVPTSYSENSQLNDVVTIWTGDITHLEIGAIVNAANERLLGGGGVDGAIHRAAGPQLKEECSGLNGCKTGDAKITGGYLLPAKYVIHTVGPRGEKPDLLRSCYETSLKLLVENDQRTVAFPCISTGIYGYPQAKAAHVALQTVRTFLEKNPNKVDRVIFTLFLQEDVNIYETLMQSYFPVENK